MALAKGTDRVIAGATRREDIMKSERKEIERRKRDERVREDMRS